MSPTFQEHNHDFFLKKKLVEIKSFDAKKRCPILKVSVSVWIELLKAGSYAHTFIAQLYPLHPFHILLNCHICRASPIVET